VVTATPRWRRAKDWLVGIARAVDRENVPVIAGGLAFFALLSASPLLITIVSLYGIFSDASVVQDQVNRLAEILPHDIQQIVGEQLREIVGLSGNRLGLGSIISVGAALWVASKGTFFLLRSLNTAFGVVETRSIAKVRAISVLITGMLVVGAVVAFAVVAVLPSVVGIVLGHAAHAGYARTAIELGRWPALALAMTLALSLLYRHGPDRGSVERWRWWTPGSATVTVGWLAGSIGFSAYVSSFTKFNETYGSLGAVVVLMTWLYLSAFLVLLGALVDAAGATGSAPTG
jgi:membrane protein